MPWLDPSLLGTECKDGPSASLLDVVVVRGTWCLLGESLRDKGGSGWGSPREGRGVLPTRCFNPPLLDLLPCSEVKLRLNVTTFVKGFCFGTTTRSWLLRFTAGRCGSGPKRGTLAPMIWTLSHSATLKGMPLVKISSPLWTRGLGATMQGTV